MRRLAFACSVLLLVLATGVGLSACGTSSRVEDSLIGTWWGPALNGEARSLKIGAAGQVEVYSANGVPTGLRGEILKNHGLYFDITWYDDGGKAVFFLAPTGRHAALYVPGDTVSSLQLNATDWNPDGYVIEDLASVYCGGDSWFVANDGTVLDEAQSNNEVAVDASYAGRDGNGRIFNSPAGEVVSVLDGVRGLFRGAYEDQFRSTDADLTFLMTPDKFFVVGFANWDPWEFKDGWIAPWQLTQVAAPAGP